MPVAAFRLTEPARRTTAVVFASPHSGRDYPAAFLGGSLLDLRQIRSSEDAFVDELLAPVPGFGAPLLAALMPRAWVDLNRAPDELDPALIEGVRSSAHNPRVLSGLGVIPRVVAAGRAIRSGKMPPSEARHRLATGWHPYHDRLRRLMDESLSLFGRAILIDVHSMPREAMDAFAHRPGRRPEIVVGDRHGASASEGLVRAVEDAFRAAGFQVARNAPFAGAYIAQTYGRPALGQEAVQVEIDRSLYMDEARVERDAHFAPFARRLTPVLERIAGLGRAEGERVAAE
jgi:N-formylglutamate amidohydrolase